MILKLSDDFHVDAAKERCYITVVGVQTIDDKFLDYKTYLPWYQQPLKVNSLSRELTIHPKECCTSVNYWDQDVNVLADNYLSLQENIFKGSLQNLKTAKVISQCSLCKNHTTEVTELMKSLLEHAENLEKLVIEPEHIRFWCC
ncbi:hypothetical protein RND71_025150 [Anisodus tanguticus]|uniref:Uncharacterized protein n=1 Tax=Anisodus tanguticus TaxID=243964 RepID=A0AAE1RRY5_9SOLA|nr:hypothetical protein RND71_025150 [Anisodus tanguticus]